MNYFETFNEWLVREKGIHYDTAAEVIAERFEMPSNYEYGVEEFAKDMMDGFYREFKEEGEQG